ncbi:MAG: PAS domain S-box protein [Desulfarculaceae bacterium]|nr:PAS domain S-box protein [Desulfarculaceae bacterium]MCF8073830.1 PAS domain S-box protein [Desulfarculaceae bacterium]MCF8102810.1 PAS domain S-box protein [Desulfarculaceae bacterium]MCF8116254.1 PAS domain S-box protein [Desulfarculaceae bacterium]
MQTTPGEDNCREDLAQAAQELEKFRSIVESAELGVVTINEHHEVVYLNQAAEKMFGYDRVEILGGDLSPLIPSEHRQRHRHYVERYVRTRRGKLIGHTAELEAERKDGTRFPVSISFSMAEVGGGPLMTAIFRDLSKEAGLEQKVKQSQRLAILGEMVATVSHEIRSPLTLIGGFARQLEREDGLSHKGRDKVAIITKEVERLETILNELGDLSRPAKYNWRESDLSQVVEHVAELMEPQLSAAGASLELSKGDQLPRVMADHDRLSQVLINLINNAVQASGQGAEVRMSLSANGDGVKLEVADSGPGLDPAHLQDIFTPFFTTKSGGTGLGLPVARRIIEEHGGSIELLNGENGGAVARILLPPAPGLQQELPLG